MIDGPGLFDEEPPAEVGGPAARKLLMASAGTGKTYALAGQFATLLVLGVPPERVLATTFTRKAAGEILDRVLARVADAAEESEAGEEARAQIRDIAEDLVPGGADIVTTAHCRGVLARLLRSIGRFQVRTLDAFFVRLAGLFGDQLEIAPGWRITSEVEEKALTLEAIARLLEVAEDDEQLELLRGIARGGAERSAAASMATVVEDADELARQAVDGAWGRIAPLERPADVALSEAIRTVQDFQVPTTTKGKPDSRWAKVHQTLKDILEDFDLDLDRAALEEAMGKGFAVKALDPVPEYYKAPLPDDLVDALLVLHQLLASVRVEDLRERNAATGRLLTGYHSAERALRTELSAWRFSDFQGALLDGPARGERATWLRDVTFRLDGRIDHLLLDEFQDTAPGQWRLLLPLAEEILAGGDELRTFFCVGDVKQSIYGWRGGEPRLLGRMGERHPGLVSEPLQRSYRSSPVVLDAVNRVFDGMERRVVFTSAGREAAHRATEEWVSSFAPHESALTDLPGAARLWLAPRKRDGDRDLDSAVRFAVDRIEELYHEHPEASIGVLLRTKKELAALRFALGARRIEASDEGGKPLTDTAAVTWVLALLHLADHPEDGVARLQVARSPVAEELGLSASELDVEGEEAARAAEVAGRRLRAELTHGGLGAFVRTWAERIAPGLAAWDSRRLDQLVELAQATEASGAAGRPKDFADLVRSKAIADPSAARVKVMTIHASKGLEYDIVVLPDLGRRIELTPKGILRESADETAPPHVLSVTPKKDLCEHHPQLRDLFEGAKERSMTDALSTLYVALTRAVHGLEMIVPFEQMSGDAFSFARLFAVELADGTDLGDGSEPLLAWEHPDSTGDFGKAAAREKSDEVVEERPLSLEPGPPPVQHLRPTGPGASEDRRTRRGSLVHALLEGIEWLADAAAGDPRSDDQLRAACARVDGRPDAPTAEAIAIHRAALETDVMRSLLTRPPGDWRLERERAFDVEMTDLDGGPRRMRGAIDRLVLRLEEGRAVAATILDFKVVQELDAAALVARSRQQLGAYRGAVESLLGLEPDRVTAQVVAVTASGAVELLDVD